MNNETYKDLIMQLQTTPPGKPSRVLHKKLKKLNKNNGLLFGRRYPNYLMYISISALVISVFCTIIDIVFN